LGKYRIEYYHLKDGRCPAIEFLDSLDIKHRAKMLKSIQLVEEYGGELREDYAKLCRAEYLKERCETNE